MQTFLPYDEPIRTAIILDDKRLGKQRIEAVQIARCLLGLSSGGWQNHPAVKMWEGYESYLVQRYLKAVIKEWVARGFKNTKTQEHFDQLIEIVEDRPIITPWWFDIENLFLSHRSNLIRKKPEYYSIIWPDMPDDIEYVWPVS